MHTPTNFDQTVHSGPRAHYNNAGPLAGIPSRNDIMAEFDNGMTAILQQCLSNKQPIHFMPTEGYHTEKKAYIRVRTWNHFDRYNALKAVREVGIHTASDDLNCQYYYRKVAREERLPLSSWAVLCNYSYELTPDGIYLFRVSVNNYNLISEDEYNNPLISSALLRDRTLILTWDIETYSSRKTGEVPNAKYDEDKVFMICMTVHWKDDPEPLKQICLVDVETAPDPGWITIVCGSQTNLLKAFALCWKLLAPDIQIGFNDSQYDWRFIVEKASKLGILEWMFNHMSFKPSSLEKIIKWEYRYNMIKVNDGKFHSKHLKIPGCVAIDVQPCFMGFYPKAEKSSLAFYLNESGLESKLDMPIHRMNKYYERALNETNATTAEQMREIAKYCIIDALSCQRLMIKRNAINEYREIASIAFLSLFDAHYFAGGMKVCNLLGASAWRDGILTSTISIEQTETGKYPGAYVFPPIKGLENRRPVTGLDFASLYPNLIITYNLSPDKIILSEEQALSVECSGKKLHKIEIPFNNRLLRAWSVRHNNIPEEKGLYANVLEYLSAKRNEMKKRLAPLKAIKEDMELVISSLGLGKSLSLSEAIEQVLANAKEEKRTGLTKNLYHFINQEKHEFMAEYDSVSFECSCLDAKQYAFKVYMNTFYGTAGDSKSPFFLREFAGGVTSAGQKNIKLVADFVKNKGFGIKYGDTDSLYLICSEECFQKCDEAYVSGNGISKEEYWSRMVEISMVEMEKLRDEVNDFLKEDNGSPYLKMAYEEVLFPVVFTGKKKYYGIPHESKPNFNKKLFIRGVEVVKRGQSKHFREVGKKVMEESMRLDNTRTLHRIVEDVLKETINDISQIDLNGVIKTAVWKPDKNNKSVQRFISRMRDRHTREEADAKRLIKKGLTPEPYLYEIPEPGERFEYIVVENDSTCASGQRVGDKMEYPEVVRRLGKKIDISYYLKTVVGLCARFINYDEIYQPSSEIVLEALKKLKDDNVDEDVVDEDDLDENEEDEEVDEDEISKIRDALAQKSAEKWVRGYIKELHTGPKKDHVIISHLWKEANTYAKNLFNSTYADKIVKYSGNDAYWSSYLNALDKQEQSIRLKLTTLLAEISKIDVGCRDGMYKLVTKVGFESNEIRLPITEEDRQEFRKIIADQEKMRDIVMDDYQFLQRHGHNGKGGNRIHIGWLLACTVADAEKVLINPPEEKRDLSKKVLTCIEKRFEEVPLAPVLIR
ncbi:DNA/RNA polymerase [Rhizophagus irregularis]|uniref:DNA polymerase n=1 Tax=Rhizophagus irregularis TaxID=588596 RepID=A0A2N0R966_9GLOM|nr:DNA/RNA polymerase [Rhizophagus irregularis]